jgi:hypothetical protein
MDSDGPILHCAPHFKSELVLYVRLIVVQLATGTGSIMLLISLALADSWLRNRLLNVICTDSPHSNSTSYWELIYSELGTYPIGSHKSLKYASVNEVFCILFYPGDALLKGLVEICSFYRC